MEQTGDRSGHTYAMEDESKPMGQGCRWPNLHIGCSCISIFRSRLDSENIFWIFLFPLLISCCMGYLHYTFHFEPNLLAVDILHNKLSRGVRNWPSLIDAIWTACFPLTLVQSDRAWKSASFSHLVEKPPDTGYHCLLSQDGICSPSCAEGLPGSMQLTHFYRFSSEWKPLGFIKQWWFLKPKLGYSIHSTHIHCVWFCSMLCTALGTEGQIKQCHCP